MKPIALFTVVGLTMGCRSEEKITATNSIPEVSIFSHSDGDQVLEGYLITLRALVNDTDHDYNQLSVTWSSNQRTLCENVAPDPDNNVECAVQLQLGETDITAQVTDDGGASGITSITLDVLETYPPVAQILTPAEEGVYYENRIISFSASITDTEDSAEELTYTWSSTRDGELPATAVPTTTGLVTEDFFLTEGEHVLSLNVIDQTGKTGFDTKTITVLGPNNAPLCEVTSPTDQEVFLTGEEVVFVGRASDTETGVADLQISWSSDLDGFLGAGTIAADGEVELSFAGLSDGLHSISLNVVDGAEETCTSTIQIGVGTPPEVVLIEPLSDAVYSVGESVSFEATVNDNEEAANVILLSWESDVSGVFSTQGADSSGVVSFGVNSLSPGVHNISVTATDSIGMTDVETVSIRVNNAPTAPTVSITPDPATTIDDLVALASASTDADGDNVSYVYEWYLDGAATTNAASVLPASETEKGDLWTVRVTPTDGYQLGAYTEESLVISNTAPTIDSLSITPAMPNLTDTLTCNVSTTDPDNDTPIETYQWTNVTTSAILGTSSTLTLDPNIATPGDVISCAYTIDDGQATASSSTTVYVSNTGLTVTDVLITPQTATIGDQLTCAVVVDDPDLQGYTEAFVWTNATSGLALGTGSTLTVDSSMANPTDEIECSATVVDPAGATGSGAGVIILGNQDPVINSVTFTESNPTVDDTITCVADAEDPDDDVLTLSYEWTNNTTSAVLANTEDLLLDAAVVTGGDTITCTVTAEDSYGGSDVLDSSITLDNSLPVIASVSISDAAPLSSDTIDCTVVASDPDGDALTTTITWENTTTQLTIGTGSSLTLSSLLVQPGDSIECAAEVFDGTNSVTDSDYATVGNMAPVIDSLSIAPSEAYIGDTLTCTAVVNEPDQEAYGEQYQWTNVTQGTLIGGSGATLQLSTTQVNPTDEVQCALMVTDGAGATATDSTSITVANQPPVIDSLSLDATTISLEDTITCIATATDPEGETPVLTYEWTNVNTGTTIGTTAALVPDATMATGGDELACSVTAEDSYGDSTSSSVSFTLDNTAPEIASVSISDATPFSSDTIDCTVVASDPDGDALTTTITWINENEQATIGTGTTLVLSPLSVQPGDSIRCDAEVFDGSETVIDSAYAIVSNSAPNIVSLTVSPSESYIGDTLNCAAVVDEPDQEAYTEAFVWTNVTQGSSVGSTSSLLLSSSQVAPTDELECSLTITDSSGSTASSSTTITVGNQAPLITSLTLDSSSLSLGDTITCSATASDPEGDIPVVSYEWSNTTTGTVLGSLGALTVDSSMATGGDEITCTVTATDSASEASSQSTSIVVGSSEPVFTVAASVTPSSGVTADSVLTCSGTAVDPDGAAVSLSYEWTNQTAGTTVGSSTSISLDATLVAPTETLVCTITATDVAGDTATSAASVTVMNSVPEVSDVLINPQSNVQTSSTLTCSGVLTDVDQEGLSLSYEWFVAGSSIGTGSSITLDPTLAQPGQSVSCVASVTDTFGAAASASSSVSVSGVAPVISSISTSPSSAYNDSVLTCSVSASDADNQSLTESYTWSNLTTGSSIGSSASVTLSSLTASPGDVLLCEVTVSDASGQTDSSSTQVTLDNRAPNTPSVSITPDPAYLASTLTCSASASEPDFDSVSYTYAWDINGATASETSDSFTGGFVVGDVVTCTVVATDGTLSSASGTGSVTISNTAPTITSVSLSPDPVYTDGTLTATASGTDADGDSITFSYTWSVNGLEVQSGSDNTLDGSLFVKGDSVLVSVVATDGSDNSSAVTETIVVSNTAPEAPTVSISPGAPVEQVDDVVCSISAASTDADSDSVTYTFSWTVDGAAYSGASDSSTTSTVLASETAAGETWICSALPNDGTEDGSVGSTSATIDSDWDGALTFTNCGQTGRTGPSQSQCDSSYSGGTLAGEVTVSGGIQSWTVPSTRSYVIEVQGAAGGTHGETGYTGGDGAQMIGTFALTEGEVVNILVGQMGGNSCTTSGSTCDNAAPGGGGGTFVWIEGSSIPLIVAGGGGGGNKNNSSNVDAVTSTVAQDSESSSNGGSGGNGGGLNNNGGSYWAGGGAGWVTDGTAGNISTLYQYYATSPCSSYCTSNSSAEGGRTPANGGFGGIQWADNNPGEGGDGGFGGGGGGGSDNMGTGGGGGYSGGGGASSSPSNGAGGGGGSYNDGTSQSNTGAYNSSHGTVIIDVP